MDIQEFIKNNLLEGHNFRISLADSSSFNINSEEISENDVEKIFFVDGYVLGNDSSSQNGILININQFTKVEVSKEKFE